MFNSKWFSGGRTWLVASLCALVLVPSGIAVDHAATHHEEIATTWLTIPVLLLTAITAYQVLPRRASIELQKHTRRVQTDDVIFYLYSEQAWVHHSGGITGAQYDVPRDILINVPAVLINIGGRKAVVSDAVGWLCDCDGSRIELPIMPSEVPVSLLVSRTRYSGAGPVLENQLVPPPYVLDPDDVVAVQFRSRPQINWSHHWNLDAVRELYRALDRPVARLTGIITWRRGAETIETPFTIPINAVQQENYREQLRYLTDNFSAWPGDIEIRTIAD
jgi:hypothetical protein